MQPKTSQHKGFRIICTQVIFRLKFTTLWTTRHILIYDKKRSRFRPFKLPTHHWTKCTHGVADPYPWPVPELNPSYWETVNRSMTAHTANKASWNKGGLTEVAYTNQLHSGTLSPGMLTQSGLKLWRHCCASFVCKNFILLIRLGRVVVR